MAVILTVICLCMQIGAFNLGGVDVAKVYNLWFTDPIGKRHFDVWPLMAILLPTAALGTYAIFIFHNRKAQALLCALNALLIAGWYVCFFVVGQIAGDKSWVRSISILTGLQSSLSSPSSSISWPVVPSEPMRSSSARSIASDK